jgi:hypothetical protein
VPWETAALALRGLDVDGLTPAARTLVAMCFVDAGEEPPFTLTRRDLLAGFAVGMSEMSEGDIEEFLDEVGATPEELEEVLGQLTQDADEWGRPTSESSPLHDFRSTLSDELMDLTSVARGAHLDTLYLLDDYLDSWTDCRGTEEVTVEDLIGFSAWYLIAHTSATQAAVVEHIERLPRIAAIIDRHFGTHLVAEWSEQASGLDAEVARAMEATDLIAEALGGPCASVDTAEDGHWEILAKEPTGLRLRRLEDGAELGPAVLSKPAFDHLREGDVVNLLLAEGNKAWTALDAGPAYPARVAELFRARADHS